MNDLTREWVKKAEGDYRYAIIGMRANDASVYDGVCYHCQQAAEKYLKAFLVENQVEFRPKHDLLYLFNLSLKADATIEFIRIDLEFLNDYAVDIRYPGDSADKTEARKALNRMKVVRKEIRAKLGLAKLPKGRIPARAKKRR